MTEVSVLDMVSHILRAMGSTLEPEVRNEAVNEIRHQYLSAAKARTRLQWKPMFAIEEGLEHTVRWYRDFLGR